MKSLLTIFILICFSKADGQITRPPLYDTCNYIRPFEGEWVYSNGTDTIKVYLRFHRSYYSDPETYSSIMDGMWGWIEYKQGSTIVMSDYSNRFSTLPYDDGDIVNGLKSITIWPSKPCSNPQINLVGVLDDIAKCRTRKKIMAIVNGSGPGATMTWKLMQPIAFVDAGCGRLTLPAEFTLVKQ